MSPPVNVSRGVCSTLWFLSCPWTSILSKEQRSKFKHQEVFSWESVAQLAAVSSGASCAAAGISESLRSAHSCEQFIARRRRRRRRSATVLGNSESNGDSRTQRPRRIARRAFFSKAGSRDAKVAIIVKQGRSRRGFILMLLRLGYSIITSNSYSYSSYSPKLSCISQV